VLRWFPYVSHHTQHAEVVLGQRGTEPLGPFVQTDEALVGGTGGPHKELVLVVGPRPKGLGVLIDAVAERMFSGGDNDRKLAIPFDFQGLRSNLALPVAGS
jgi:hypothetical protein